VPIGSRATHTCADEKTTDCRRQQPTVCDEPSFSWDQSTICSAIENRAAVSITISLLLFILSAILQQRNNE
jgi:hypothetical protein